MTQPLGSEMMSMVEHGRPANDSRVVDEAETPEEDFRDLLAAVLEKANLHRESLQVALPKSGIPTDAVQAELLSKWTKEDFVTVELKKLPEPRQQAMRRLLIESALHTQDQDNSHLMAGIQQRMQRVGVQPSAIEVRYENITVEAFVNAGDRGMPTVLNFFRDYLDTALTLMRLMRNKRRRFTILDSVSGVLKPGRFTLLLGPPSSGKSTLLKVLSGVTTNGSDGLRVHGNITYNGETFKHFQVRRTSAYVEQVDNHLPEMTVRETLDFAARCLGAGDLPQYVAELRRREKEQGVAPNAVVDAFMKVLSIEGHRHSLKTDYLLQILGLNVCADTIVGNAMMRGISGGQKKRVTTGEYLAGPAKALFMDEISTGLDSSTTFLITSCLRNFAHMEKATVLVALLQPPPEVYDLFDDVMVLSEGHLVYHGPREQVVPFFTSLGFAIPERKGVADFLQEVTSRKDQRQYWANPSTPYQYIPVSHISQVFKSSDVGRSLAAAVAQPHLPVMVMDKDSRHSSLMGTPNGVTRQATPEQLHQSSNDSMPAAAAGTTTPNMTVQITLDANGAAHGHANGKAPVDGQGAWSTDPLVRRAYALRGWDAFKACYRRDFTLMTRNTFLYSFKTFQTIFVGISAGTLFLYTRRGHTTIQDGSIYLGLLFFSLAYNVFSGFEQMAGLVMSLPVYFKQRDSQFFPSWAFALPPIFLRLPFFAFDAMLWSVIIYWLTGLAPSAGCFFIFYAYMLLLSQVAIALFRLLGALGRDFDIANNYGSLCIIILLINSGFILSKGNTHPWWIWCYWMSPLTYAQQAISINEMRHSRWDTPVEYNGQIMRTGDAVLLTYDFFTDRMWLWLAAVIMIGYLIILHSLTSFMLWFFGPLPQGAPTFSEEFLQERNANIKGLEPGAAAAAAVQRPSAHLQLTVASATAQRKSSDMHHARQSVDGLSRLPSPPPGRPSLSMHSGLQTAASAATALSSNVDRGMVLPFKPMALTFHNICYDVDMPSGAQDSSKGKQQGGGKPQLQLLTNISGTFRPGVLTALMGVSGAGKTTLMDVLAGRKTIGTITGDIKVDGFVKEQENFTRICGYVEQNDIHMPRTTVREALQISAILRLYDVDKETVEAFVDEVMELVELKPIKDSIVGLPGQFGLSVEQRKRLTIAVELVANPSIVFMDEPTSGLDARAAAIVMRTVRNTVDTGRTVVCTIHQPSVDIFDAFDELLLLKRGGRTIFHGPLGHNSVHLVNYFQSIPGVAKLPQGLNPATWMLEITSLSREQKIGKDFADLYLESDMFRRTENLIAELSVPKPGTEPISFNREYAVDRWTQFKVLMKRSALEAWRNPNANAVRLVFCTILGLLLGSIYWALGHTYGSTTNVTNIMGALFLCMTFLGFSNMSNVLPVAATARPVFYRERAAHMYSTLPYAVAQALAELPYVLGQSILYGTVTFFMIHFQYTAAKYFWYLLFTFLGLMFFTYYAMMSTAIVPVIEMAQLINICLFNVWFLMGGYFIPHDSMPPWASWYYYLDPLSWALYGLISSQLGDVSANLTDNDGNQKSVAQYVYDYLGYRHNFIGWTAFILIAFIVFFVCIMVGALKFLNFNRR